MSIAENIVGTHVDPALLNFNYSPGLISIRRCDTCGELDHRAWYTSAAQAAENDAKRPTRWGCAACAGDCATIVRGWFDTVYGPR